MSIAYFDCFHGAGGDMIVGALVDAGADEQALRDALASLGLAGYDLAIEPGAQHGLAATSFEVRLDSDAKQPARKLGDIQHVIRCSSLSDFVKERSLDIFNKLAIAEAAVHGSHVEDVHFHEVGAVDAILDVVGAAVALELLRVERVYCSPLPVGSGTVDCQHGTLPVPAPATAELLKNVPIVSGPPVGELTTPTAAAVLTTVSSGFGPVPAMTLRSVGYGAGARESDGLPNLLRVLVGEPSQVRESDCVTVLQTSVDDASPEVIGHCLQRLLDAGALDAYAQPIHMKKWRSGVLLTVVCESALTDILEQILFSETPTFGIRRSSVERTRLPRRVEPVATAFGEIRLKIGERSGVVTASPEYEDCKAAAAKHRVALRDVIAAARAAWRANHPS